MWITAKNSKRFIIDKKGCMRKNSIQISNIALKGRKIFCWDFWVTWEIDWRNTQGHIGSLEIWGPNPVLGSWHLSKKSVMSKFKLTVLLWCMIDFNHLRSFRFHKPQNKVCNKFQTNQFLSNLCRFYFQDPWAFLRLCLILFKPFGSQCNASI